MAPSPVLNIEPKGPDKSGEKCTESVLPKDQQNAPKSADDNVTSKEKISVDQLSFAEIEEAGLKSLLDEAYSYKSPKDRLGKSNLFQVLLNEVEENDASKKTLSERSNIFADSRANASVSAVGNGHDTVQDKAFLNNILGGCEKEKKKKKNKRDGSSASSSSRRPKFSHSLKINHGPQSSSHVYNGGNAGSASNAHYNGSSRSLSRAQQSFTSRISNTKTAALLTTSSSNIDIPMVTTYNKQPIMTPALVPSTQKASDLITLDLHDQNSKSTPVDDTSTTAAAIALSPKSAVDVVDKEHDAIEMKILESNKNNNRDDNDSVYNYTTRASLEIGNGGAVDGCVKQCYDYDKDDAGNATPTAGFPSQPCSNALTNGNADRSSMQHTSPNSQQPVNGLSDEKEDIDNVLSNNNNAENEEDKHSKKKSHHDNADNTKQPPCSDNINDNASVGTSLYATSVDEPKTMTSLLQKSAQNSSTNNSAFKYHAEPSYSYPWHVPNLIVTLTGESMAASLGRNYCTKESLESRRLYDENTNTLNSSYPYLSNNTTSMNRERQDNGSERKHKVRKPKKQNTTSVLSENIAGYCGDKSVEYLVEYIENTKPNGEGGTRSGVMKTKSTGKTNSRASTDDDVRSKKPNKAKDRLKKSTSLEDLRHNKSSSSSKPGQNKKQSSIDDSDFTKASTPIMASAPQAVETAKSEPRTNDAKALSDDSSHLYYDSVDHVDDDNYTETDFHLVTKKQRKKKRRSKSRTTLEQNFLPHNYTDRNDNGNFATAYQNSKRSTRSTENRHRSRRKSVSSVVPSDKISDSDSIHSLPVSSTTPKCKIKKKSTSSGCTPQASYADIAKSPQCNSSTTLNGDAGKWHSSLKTFSNSPPSAYSTTAQSTSNSTTAGSCSLSTSASSSNTGDTPEHSDNSELVSVSMAARSCKSGDDSNVGSDQSCDQLLLTNNDNSFNEQTSAASMSPPSSDEKSSSTSNTVYSAEDKDGGAGSGPTECDIEVMLKRKSKSSNDVKHAENDTNNNTPHVNDKTVLNGIDTKTPKDYHSKSSSNSSTVCNNNINNSHNVNHSNSSNIINNNNNNSNTNATKTKKSRNKKNKNNNSNVDDNEANDNHDANCCKIENSGAKNANDDLFIEFTLKCAPSSTAATTKTSETQTDSENVEVNNNACNRYHHHHNNNSNGCNDVNVEETIVLICNKSNGVSSDGSQSQTSVDKLSHSLPTNNETGQTVLLLNDNNSPNNSAPSEIVVDFDVNEQLLEDAASNASKERQQSEFQKEINERSAKYNVTEVIQYVNKNWNEVVKNLASSKMANSNKKVQYYVGK